MNYLRTLALIAVFFAVFPCLAWAQTDSPDPAEAALVPAGLSLSGSGRTVWLVDASEQTFDIMQFEAGKEWLSLTRGVTGSVRWSQGSERFLYVITGADQGVMLIYSPLDSTPRMAGLPTEGASLASAKLLGGWAGNGLSRGDAVAGQLGPSLLLLGLPQGDNAAPTFWMYSTEWTQFAGPEGLTLTADAKVFCTVAGGQIYMLTGDAEPTLWHESTPGEWSTVATPELAEDETVLGLLSLNDVPTLVTTTLAPEPEAAADASDGEATDPAPDAPVESPAPAEAESTPDDDEAVPAVQYLVHLRAFSAGAFAEPATVAIKDVPLALPAEPQATGHTGRVLLLWAEGDIYRTAVADAAGAAEEPKNVPLTSFVDPDPANVKLFEYFSYGLIGLTVLLAIAGRAKPATGRGVPIILPPEFRPSGLLRRIGALLIDLLMGSVVWTFVLLRMGIPLEEITSKPASEQSAFLMNHIFASEPATMATLVVLAGFILYSAVLEKAVGGTLGKLIVKIRVVGPAGKALTWREALLRNAAKPMELITIWLPALFIMLNPTRQRLGDVLARTLVVEPSGLSLQQIEDIRVRMQEMGVATEEEELAATPPSPFDRDDER